jgi:rare lipoprotein A (peptidoglycan hydrolase)
MGVMRYATIVLLLGAAALMLVFWLDAIQSQGRPVSAPSPTATLTTVYTAPGQPFDPGMRHYATPALYVPPWAQTAALVARRVEQVDPRATKPPNELAPVPTSPWHTTIASSYGIGDGFLGLHMACGGPLTATQLTVAQGGLLANGPVLPCGQRIIIQFRGRMVTATVTDRGPFILGRGLDLGPGVARALRFDGLDIVRWRVVN